MRCHDDWDVIIFYVNVTAFHVGQHLFGDPRDFLKWSFKDFDASIKDHSPSFHIFSGDAL